MELRQPENMNELVYMTRRNLGETGKAMAWVFREKCPKCNNALMGKPLKKDGKPKIRADEYECPECKYLVSKGEYEETLMCNIEYTCPDCDYSGGIQVPFKRKKIKGADAVIFNCEGCDTKIPVTKKMKALKEKK